MTQLYNLKSDDSVVSSFDYGYDPAGNRTSVVEADGAQVAYGYDAANQLTSEARSGAHAYDHSFEYDPLGNRLAANLDGAITTSAYDAANQQKTEQAGSGVTSYIYDGAGNQQVIEKPGASRTTNTWSYENQITQVENGTGVIQAAQYNADNQRVERVAEGTTKRYLYDGLAYLGETDGAEKVSGTVSVMLLITNA